MIVVFGRSGQVAQALEHSFLPAEGVCLGRPQGDITDAVAVARCLDQYPASVVVNAGAYTQVDRAESEPDEAHRVNAEGVRILAEACRDRNLPLIHLSTDYVFDGTQVRPYTEDDPVAPLGAYGRSKAEGEDWLRKIWPRHVILRTAWVYSPHGQNFMKTMLRVGGSRAELRVVDDQRGTPTSAKSIAQAVLTIARGLQAGRQDGFGTFHCVAGGETTWYGFACEIFRQAAAYGGPCPQVVPIPTRDYPTPARRPANSVLDCQRLGGVWNIAPRAWQDELADALAAMYDLPADRVW